MSTAQPQQYPINLQPVQVWNGQFTGEAQVTFLNGDPSSTIFIGNQSNFSETANAIPIKPSSTVTVDGKRPWFVSGPPGSANCTVIPGSIQYSPGTSIVTDLIGGAIQLPFTITNGNFLQTGIIATANFQSFNNIIRAHTPNVGLIGAPFTADVQFNWYADAAGTIPLFIDEVIIWSGGPGSGQDAYIRGPIGGPYLQITVAGANATSPIVVDQFLLYGSPNVITTIEARQSSVGSGILNNGGFLGRSANDDVFTNIAATFSYVLAATTDYLIALPLMPGEIFTQFSTTAALANPLSLAQAKGLINGAITPANPPGTFYNPANVLTPVDQEIIAPRSPMYIVIATAGATTVTFTAMGNGRSVL